MKTSRAAVVILVAFLAVRTSFASLTLGQEQLGNIFLTTETVRVPISGLSGTSVAWTATDYSGAIVGSGSVAASGGTAAVEPNLNRRGWFELHLKELNGPTVVAQKSTTFAVVTPVSVAGMGDSPFGVMTHFAQSNNPAMMPLLARAGIAHLRDEHYWQHIETAQGVYTYPAKFTNFMSAAAASGITPLMPLTWSNQFYDYEQGDFTAPHSDNGRLGYANYASELLSHYGSQLQFVEGWNEYNAGTFIKGPAAADKDYYYYLMMKKVHETIKPSRPDVTILGGGTVPIAHGFLRDVFAQGTLPYLDAISVHPYRGFAEGVDLEIDELRALIQSHNSGVAKPIWATEFSLNVNAPEKLKPGAAYLAKIVTLMRTADVARMYYYLMQDDNSFPYRGLVQKTTAVGGPYIPNPAYVAYANTIRQLYNRTAAGRLAGTEGSTYAFKFTQSGQPDLHVLWANAPTTVFLTTASNLTVTDLMGQETVLSPNGGEVALGLTSNTIYVKGPVTAITEDENPVVADSVDDYAKTQGANGWYYGYANLASNAAYSPTDFQQMTWGIWQGDNYRWLGTSTFHFMQQGSAHPSSAWAIRRWIATNGGPQRLTGTISRGTGGDGVGFRVFVDGNEIYSYPLSPGASHAYDVTALNVSAGSKIDFAITQGGNNTNDATSFTARITDLAAWPDRPPAPFDLNASTGDLQISLAWTGSTVADHYQVKRATTPGGPYTVVASPTTANYTDNEVIDGATHYYVISAVNLWGDSVDSYEIAGQGEIKAVASASAQQSPNETADKAFDGVTSTKWYTGAVSPSGWLQYFFGGRGTIRKTVIRYDLISANDRQNRDPKDWTFQGSNDGVNWTTLDTRTGEIFASRLQTKQYLITNTTAYAYYRLNISNTFGGTNDGIQLAEMALSALPPTTITFESIAAHDGWVTESAVGSDVGGSSSSTSLRGGDDKDKQLKAILSFDTSLIPDGASVASAVLRLKKASSSGGNPFDTHGACYVDLKGGNGFGGAVTLHKSDFEAVADATAIAALDKPTTANGNVSTGTLNAEGRDAVNKTGHTQLRVYFPVKHDSDGANDFISWHPGDNSDPANRPVLEIVYQ